MWSWSTNVTGRRRDGRTTCNRNNVLCTSASRGKKSTFIKHVRMYYGSGTVCMREVTLSARNDVMAAAVSKLWGQIENPTPPMVGIYWGGGGSCQILSRSVWKRRSLGLFGRDRSKKKKKQHKKEEDGDEYWYGISYTWSKNEYRTYVIAHLVFEFFCENQNHCPSSLSLLPKMAPRLTLVTQNLCQILQGVA